MDLVSRLKQYLDSRQISVTQFADECGIPRPTASQLLAGRNKKVSDEIIGKIHQCYPALNIIWLMFGEGNMVTAQNIETSSPQNNLFSELSASQHTESQGIPLTQEPQNAYTENPSVKFEPTSAHLSDIGSAPLDSHGREFTFNPQTTSGSDRATFTFGAPMSPARPQTTQLNTSPSAVSSESEPRPITVMPDKGKRVTGIVVYYDDRTYESFIPDPDQNHRFFLP